MFRNLPKYQSQRRTEMLWCPTVPVHWELVRNKSVLVARSVAVGTQHADYDLLSLTKAGVIYRDIDSGKGKMPASFDTYQVIEKGDLIMCLFDVDETPRTVGRARQSGMITGAYDRFQVQDDVLAEYVNWFYMAVDNSKGLRPLYRGLRKTVPLDKFLASQFPLPPAEEQAAIAKYLAHANARIDKAIAAKRRLIALLEEQTAFVSRQVLSGRSIEGIDLDSGDRVPWLGRVPAAWGALPLKRLSKLRSGAGFPVDRQGRMNQELPFFRVSDMGYPGNEVFLDYCDSTVSRDESAELGAVIFEPESICFPKVGGALLTNKRRILKRSSCLDNNLMGAAFFGLEVDYAYEIMKLVDMSDVAKPGPVPAVGQGDVGRIVLPVPPKEVQHALVEALRLSQQESARAADVASREIALLQEFRTRLVADVVTGQVDVRAIAAMLPDAPQSFDNTFSATDDDLEEALSEGEE